MKTIILYCLSFLIAAPAWSATILSGVVDLTITADLDGIYLDLESAMLTSIDDDFSDSQVNFFFGGDGVFSGDRFLPARIGTGSSDPVRNLPEASVVSSEMFFADPGFGGSMMHVGVGANQFENGMEGYLGFKFDRLDDGSFTFGWMRVTLTNGSSTGTVHEWAYSDTPGEIILVGGSVIPEPASGMMLLLTSCGIAFLRRKR